MKKAVMIIKGNQGRNTKTENRTWAKKTENTQKNIKQTKENDTILTRFLYFNKEKNPQQKTKLVYLE